MDFYARKVKVTKTILELYDKGSSELEISRVIDLNFGWSDKKIKEVLLKFRPNGAISPEVKERVIDNQPVILD